MSGNIPDIMDLRQIIEAFDASTAKLKSSHDALQEHIAELTGELSRKNRGLSESFATVNALKNYLANILESITDGVLAIDLDRRVVAFNAAALEVVPDVTAMNEGRFVLDVLPRECRELGVILMQALSEKKKVTNREVSFVTGDGGKCTLSVSASPIRNESGALLGAVETFRDLTEIKELENRAARQDRLAALGEMAAGVAHEIRNPLGGIELYAAKIRRNLPDDSKEAELAGKIMKASSSLEKIVSDMLTFTRSREPVARSIPLKHMAHSALEMAAGAVADKNITVDLQDKTAGKKMAVDPDLLARACLNVILNAVQAMAPGGRLEIICAREKGNSGGATISFADDGPGIPDDIKGKLFNPFFTTRQEGTGLGLAIVHKILQDHGGSVTVEDNLPRGTVFIFHLPG